MPNTTFRISLPGYDAGTDTNLDHFALYADQDNVLIKEYTRGGTSIAAGGTEKIAHNLGYVPFFLAYTDILGNGTWELVPPFFAVVTVPPVTATSDTGTLTMINNDGTAHNFKWYIFYDNFTSNAGTFTSTSQALKVSKAGKDISSNDPNDYIFHSDLNTFKIISEGTTGLSYVGTTAQTLTFNHNANLGTPSSYMAFMKFPDGYTTILPGDGRVYSFDSDFYVEQTYITPTQIGLTATGTGNATLYVKYYVFETPLP